MPSWAILLVQQLGPIILAILAPLITALAEKLGIAIDYPLPNATKPAINMLAGVALAGSVADPQTAALAGPIGAMVGNRIREAMNKKKPGT